MLAINTTIAPSKNNSIKTWDPSLILNHRNPKNPYTYSNSD